MKRFSTLAVLLVAVLATAACAKKTRIEGTLAGAPDSQVIVKLLDVNTYKVLDTLKTNASGAFSYKMDVLPGQPEFVYLFYGDRKIASLLLENGDRVRVSADTLGAYTVEGSPESEKLQQIETEYNAFLQNFVRDLSKTDVATASPEEIKALQRSMGAEYVAYYRKALSYVLTNSHSLTTVPVLFQRVTETFPIFNQDTDAIIFGNVCDSLKTVYPDSRYVKALEREANARKNTLQINQRIQNAPELGYPDLNLPDVNGSRVALSSLDARVVLVHFWSATDATHVLFNAEVLKPLYEKYHAKGFDIYEICVDTDKAQWASVLRNQQLPWTNVCDGLGVASPALPLYGVDGVPTSVLIVDGTLNTTEVEGEAGLRRLLDRTLR
ncbi:MAG: AhpC/TSA family protein [Bacteroidales bacterium]|nr:AhpC/TSA family protein [Bacteroidales bacterium]